MKQFIILTILSLLVSACVTYPFGKDQYIKGTVVGTSALNEYGLVEFSNDHFNFSYMALYSHDVLDEIDSISRFRLYQEAYFKVKEKKDIPFAYEFSLKEPIGYKEYKNDVITSLNYHSLIEHGEKRTNGGAHILGHWPKRNQVGTSQSRIGFEIEQAGYPAETFWFTPEQKVFLENIDAGKIYMDYNTINNHVISIDTCHVHGNRIIECRNSQE